VEKIENKRLYRFGEFRLDAANRLLRRDEKVISLTPKEFELLFALVERAGEVVKKDELLDKVWADTFVEEGTLTRNISWLRKKLEAAASNGDQFIETIPKRGYRFLPIVTVAAAPTAVAVVAAEENTLIQIPFPVERRATVTDYRFPISDSNKPANGSQQPSQKHVAAEKTDERVSRRNLKWLPIVVGIFAVCALAVFGAYQIYFRALSKPMVVARIVPFSGSVGLENTPAFSPDGKQLTCAWNGDNGENADIYVRLLSGGEPIRLTDTPLLEQYPTFSPDGSQIAFVRTLKNGGEVVMIPALGGAERRIAQLFSGFASISFSPDGSTLAVIDTENSVKGKPHAVYLVNLQTGARRRVNAPGDFVGETTPRFSPDGKSIAFVRVFDDKNQDLFVSQINGDSAPRQMTFDRKVIHSLAWSAAGDEIYFVASDSDNQTNVRRVSASSGESQPVMTGGEKITNLAVAPNEKTIAFVVNRQNLDIWRASKNQPTEKKFVALTYSEQYPAFSPDGSHTAFLSNRSGKNEVWTADAEGKNMRQLTESVISAAAPSFSPDGSTIAYSARSEKGSDIYLVAVQGGTIRHLTEEPSLNTDPVWSADGAWIYFTSNRTGERNIWKIPSAGGETIQVTRQGALQAVAAPDSTVFFSRDNDNALRRATADDNEQIVPALANANVAKVWTATAKGIYFLADAESETYKIKFYDFQTNQIRDVADNKFPANVLGSFAVSPDENTFLYTRQDQNTTSIMLAEIEK
jgi:Tol biopolymer transport system component/DNA-binding winged helix-turn-helix (wHTH) protein